MSSAEMPELRISRSAAAERIEARCSLGRALNSKYGGYHSPAMIEKEYQHLIREMISDFILWDGGNKKALREMFTTSYFADEYSDVYAEDIANVLAAGPQFRFFGRERETDIEIGYALRTLILNKLHYLNKLPERLDLIEESGSSSP